MIGLVKGRVVGGVMWREVYNYLVEVICVFSVVGGHFESVGGSR